MDKIKVILADDHDLFRNGLQRMLAAEKKVEIVGEARDGNDAVKKVGELLPDVVLMDIKMPGIDGIEATLRIKRECPSVEVIILSMFEDDEHLFKAIKAGARGYVLKNSSVDEVIRVIKAAVRGESLLNPTMARRILDEFTHPESESKSSEDFFCDLTERELDILKLLTSAKSNREISKNLFISEKTVKNHISNIYRKLQVNTRTEAMLKAVQMGLTDLKK